MSESNQPPPPPPPINGRSLMILRSLLLFAAARLSLNLFGFRRTIYQFKRSSSKHVHDHDLDSTEYNLLLAQEITKVVQLANRRYALQNVNCLPESLTLWWTLRRAGIDADFKLGARMMSELFSAHAWVEYDGHVLNDRIDINLVYASWDLDI